MATHMLTRFCGFCLHQRLGLLSTHCQQLIRFESNESSKQSEEDLEVDNEFRTLQILPTKKAERVERKTYLAEVKFESN